MKNDPKHKKKENRHDASISPRKNPGIFPFVLKDNSVGRTVCFRLVLNNSGRLHLVLLVKTEVEGTDDRISVVDGDWAHVGKGLDLGGAVKSLSVFQSQKICGDGVIALTIP